MVLLVPLEFLPRILTTILFVARIGISAPMAQMVVYITELTVNPPVVEPGPLVVVNKAVVVNPSADFEQTSY